MRLRELSLHQAQEAGRPTARSPSSPAASSGARTTAIGSPTKRGARNAPPRRSPELRARSAARASSLSRSAARASVARARRSAAARAPVYAATVQRQRGHPFTAAAPARASIYEPAARPGVRSAAAQQGHPPDEQAPPPLTPASPWPTSSRGPPTGPGYPVMTEAGTARANPKSNPRILSWSRRPDRG